MPREIDYPGGGYIVLPDRWLGEHARRRDEAVIKADDLPRTFRDFEVALALVEDWKDIPDLDGNPENWDFEKMSWELMDWMIKTVLGDLATALTIPKAS
jgi:hypothetical protein